MESIQRDGRPVRWFGVGAPPDAGAGIATLQAAAAQPGVTVAQLQAAGNAAVGAVGPALDTLSGSNPDVMKLTQQAWQLNGKLATQADVDTAKALVGQMVTLYQQAQKLAAPGSGLLDWIAANKVAVIAAGAVVGSALLLVVAAPRRQAT